MTALSHFLLSAYPLAAIHRLKFCHAPPNIQYLYFIACGMSLIIFNYGKNFSSHLNDVVRSLKSFSGWDVYHSIIGVIGAFIICKLIGGTAASVVVAFVFFMVSAFLQPKF